MVLFLRLIGAGAVLAVACVVCGVPATAAGGSPAVPAAGELLEAYVPARAAPDPRARVVRGLHQFGADSQFNVVLAVAARLAPDGAWWYELSLTGRPNGQRGWVRGDRVHLEPVRNRIVVHVGARR